MQISENVITSVNCFERFILASSDAESEDASRAPVESLSELNSTDSANTEANSSDIVPPQEHITGPATLQSQRELVREQKKQVEKALQKAHTAVLLDNAYNYEGAIDAYRETCKILDQVVQGIENDAQILKVNRIVSLYAH
jgi:hypothetical protein